MILPPYRIFNRAERTDFLGAINFWNFLVLDVLQNFLEGFIGIEANSPVRIEATAPDGTQLKHPEEAVDGTPPSEIVYLTGAPAGDYEVEVEGTGTGDYTLNIKGSVKEGGQIDEEVTGSITENETQTLTATVPDDPSEEGTVLDGDGSSGGLPTEPGEPSFRDVLGVIRAYNTGGQYNGVEVSFRDVLQVISAYNAED
ncbi:hypothetical protein [Haloplanus salinarum]|uniref:hypothetical protein n=1 Tax=Haloplanus salinarum TaxID=1912324 RepID=UPI003B433DA4